jgi:hypothetical protein
MPDAIGADHFVARPMPGNQMHVVPIVAVDIAIGARAFADSAERDFAQTAQLTQSPGNLLGAREHHTHVADARERMALG